MRFPAAPTPRCFAINASTGVLTFAAAPDFEAPGDAGGDNVYDVVVRASDSGGLSDTQTLAITVTNANDARRSAPTVAATARR
jgi:serralysin